MYSMHLSYLYTLSIIQSIRINRLLFSYPALPYLILHILSSSSYLSFHPPIPASIYLLIDPFIDRSIYVSVCLFIYTSIHQSIYLSIYPSNHPPINLSIYQSDLNFGHVSIVALFDRQIVANKICSRKHVTARLLATKWKPPKMPSLPPHPTFPKFSLQRWKEIRAWSTSHR